MKLIHCDMGHMKVATWCFLCDSTDTMLLAEVYKTYLKNINLKT